MSDRFDGMDGIDPVIQEQIEYMAGQAMQATQAETVVIITTHGPAIQCAVKMSGDSEVTARAESLKAMMCVAAGCLSDQTGGQFTLMIQGPEGQLTPALPEGADVRTGAKYG